MSERPDPFSWWARARFEVQRGWKAYIAVAFLILGVIQVDIRRVAWLKAEGTPTSATIDSIYVSARDQKWAPGSVTVMATSEAGVTGIITVPRDRIRGCEVGDVILASQVGKRLRLAPWPCEGREERSDPGVAIEMSE